MDLAHAYLSEILTTIRTYRTMAERALAQVDDEQFFAALGDEDNSLAVIVKHMGGNLRSRWTDFLTTDGEKPDRDRDGEFIAEGDTRESLMAGWEVGWATFAGAIESLTPDDLARTIYIRGEAHTVTRAIQRGLLHAAYHVGQIVLLAKHAAGSEWQTLSIPRKRA